MYDDFLKLYGLEENRIHPYIQPLLRMYFYEKKKKQALRKLLAYASGSHSQSSINSQPSVGILCIEAYDILVKLLFFKEFGKCHR